MSPLAPMMQWDAGSEDVEEEEHFVPPEPPPLPRVEAITIGAVILVVAGIGLIAFPALLTMNPTLTMVVGLLLAVGGGALLVSRLRGEGPEDGDSGAVL